MPSLLTLAALSQLWRWTTVAAVPFMKLHLAIGLAAILAIGANALARPLADDPDREILAGEPPLVQLLFERAALLEQSAPQARNQQYAARLYCLAARLGSLEAQYHLGKMVLAGWGIRKSKDQALALFTIAAGQGHEKAALLLPQIDGQATDLPECMNRPGSSIDVDAELAAASHANVESCGAQYQGL